MNELDKTQGNHQNHQIKYVTWSQNLEEVRYYKKGKNDSIYEISKKVPGKSILKHKSFTENKGEECNTGNCTGPKFTNTKKDDTKNENIVGKKELRKLKRRERNKAKG